MKRTVLMPDYYPEFHCLADKCKFTCCQKWYINLTRKNYQQLRKLNISKEMENALKIAVRRTRPCKSDKDYAHIQLDKKKFCPLITTEGLCSLQQQCGYTAIPDTCKIFPRQERPSPNGMENVCSTGCEATVHLLIDNPSPIRFITKEYNNNLPYYYDYSRALKKYPILNYYGDVQKICIGILQNRSYSLQNRVILLGLALKDLESLNRNSNWKEVDHWINTKSLFLLNDNSMQKALEQIQVDPRKALASSILHCKIIMSASKGYHDVFSKAFHNLNISVVPSDEEGTQFNFDLELFEEKKKLLHQKLPNFENMLENIMVNIFFYLDFPLSNNTIWNDYKLFCFYYNFIYFICIGYMDGDYKMEDLVYAFTVCSRMVLHDNKNFRETPLDLFKQTNVDSLADMITLIYN